MRCLVQDGRQVGVLLGGLGVGPLDRRSALQQRGASDRLDVAAGQRGVAVAREDDLTLLGKLKAAVDRALGLRQDGAVSGTAAAANGAAAAVHEDKVDAVGVGPLGNGGLRLVQGQGSRGGAGVLGRIGVAQHDLKASARLGQATTNLGELDHLVQGINGAEKVLELLEQGDDVQHRHVVLVREGQAGQLVDVGDVLGRLSK